MALLDTQRKALDELDKQMISCFLQRMSLCEEIAKIKFDTKTAIFCEEREREILRKVGEQTGEMKSYAIRFFQSIMTLSKERQKEIIDALQKGMKP